MRAQHLGALVLRTQVRHRAMPQGARGTQLGDLHEEVHADREEERQAAGELVDVEPARDAVFHIFHAVGDGERQLVELRRAGFLHVIAADRNAVEPGHLARRVTEDVRDDPHARLGRVDIRVADHELLQDVVLDGPVELAAIDPLLLARDDEEGQDRDHRAVHRHADRHLVERDAVEQDLHVLDAVDRDARLADVAGHARMVAVIAAVRRQIERDAQPLLPRGEVAAIEGVRFLCGGKARILPDRPGPARVHRRLHAARERREAGQAGVANLIRRHVVGGVERLDDDPLGCRPVEVSALRLLRRRRAPVGQRRGGRRFGLVRRIARAARILTQVGFDLRHHSPLKTGLRLPRNAMPPSRESALPRAVRWFFASCSIATA